MITFDHNMELPEGMRCYLCGTEDPKRFHSNSIIGYDIAKGLKELGAPDESLDFDLEKPLCYHCYLKQKE